MNNPRDDRSRWLDDHANVTRLWRGLVAVCLLLATADFFVHKHVHFEFEGWFSFFGIYGFISCVFIVITAKGLRKLIMRDENYYGESEEEGS